LYPHWTTQAYLSEPDGELLSLARVRTKDLIYHIKDGNEDDNDYYVISPPGEASFYCVNWHRLEDFGVGVRTKKPYQNNSQVKMKADNSQTGLSDYIADGGVSQND